jgi:hypothetical protein
MLEAAMPKVTAASLPVGGKFATAPVAVGDF